MLLEKGDGSFSKATNFARQSIYIPLAAGDFNGDAIPDLTTNNTSGVSILFTPPKLQQSTPKSPSLTPK